MAAGGPTAGLITSGGTTGSPACAATARGLPCAKRVSMRELEASLQQFGEFLLEVRLTFLEPAPSRLLSAAVGRWDNRQGERDGPDVRDRASG